MGKCSCRCRRDSAGARLYGGKTGRQKREEKKGVKWRKCIWGSGNKRGRVKGGVTLRKGELDGEREGA